MKVLETSRRLAAARRFSLLAVGSLVFVVVAAVVAMPPDLRTFLAMAALCGYGYFGGRAMQCWQGRGHPSLHRRAWRRRFLNEKNDTGGPRGSEVTARSRRKEAVT